VVTFSLKARAASPWPATRPTPSPGPMVVDGLHPASTEHALRRGVRQDAPIKDDYGKTGPLAPRRLLLVRRESHRRPTRRLDFDLPHPLRGKAAANEPDGAFYEQWLESFC